MPESRGRRGHDASSAVAPDDESHPGGVVLVLQAGVGHLVAVPRGRAVALHELGHKAGVVRVVEVVVVVRRRGRRGRRGLEEEEVEVFSAVQIESWIGAADHSRSSIDLIIKSYILH